MMGDYDDDDVMIMMMMMMMMMMMINFSQPKTAAEILLSALSQAKILTSLVNR